MFVSVKDIKGVGIRKINMKEKGGVRNVSEVGSKMDRKYKQK